MVHQVTAGKNKNLKILLIDDEERFRTALAQQLACRQFNQEHG